MNLYSYMESPVKYSPENAFVGHLKKIDNKETLFAQVSKKLHFPEYFGYNWDALSDCLRDFHWIEQKQIVIVHDECPNLFDNDLSRYLEVLEGAIIEFKSDKKHLLEIVFPEEFKHRIKNY